MFIVNKKLKKEISVGSALFTGISRGQNSGVNFEYQWVSMSKRFFPAQKTRKTSNLDLNVSKCALF
jgi:hypothetical protein